MFVSFRHFIARSILLESHLLAVFPIGGFLGLGEWVTLLITAIETGLDLFSFFALSHYRLTPTSLIYLAALYVPLNALLHKSK